MEESPAIDAIGQGAGGCATDLTEDQRGEPRPQDGDNDGAIACDVGAFEIQDKSAPAAPTITSPSEGGYDNDGSFTVSGTAEPNSIVELFDGGKSLQVDVLVAASGIWSVELWASQRALTPTRPRPQTQQATPPQSQKPAP
jgi:hypothetical protein